MRKIFFIIAILCLTSCVLFNISKREIESQEGKWLAADIKNYNYTFIIASLSRDRECETPKVGIEVEVRNGQLTKFGTCELTAEKAIKYGTINRIFSMLRKERSDSPPGLEVRFNQNYGFPESIDINYSRWFSDYRIQYYIDDFRIAK